MILAARGVKIGQFWFETMLNYVDVKGVRHPDHVKLDQGARSLDFPITAANVVFTPAAGGMNKAVVTVDGAVGTLPGGEKVHVEVSVKVTVPLELSGGLAAFGSFKWVVKDALTGTVVMTSNGYVQGTFPVVADP